MDSKLLSDVLTEAQQHTHSRSQMILFTQKAAYYKKHIKCQDMFYNALISCFYEVKYQTATKTIAK
jgi:Fic family protein